MDPLTVTSPEAWVCRAKRLSSSEKDFSISRSQLTSRGTTVAESTKRTGIGRREFLATGLTTATLLGAPTALAQVDGGGDGQPLTVAGYPYERVQALQDGRVSIAGQQHPVPDRQRSAI